ncbi:MAG: LapA family protein [Chromatiales bacterium]|jgi:uncharacterized integral membrane protein
MRRAFWLLVALVLILFAAGFTVLNSGFVNLNLYFYELRLPTSVLVFVCVAAGAVLGLIASSATMVVRQSEARKLRKRITRLESELDGMRRHSEEPEATDAGSLTRAG